MATCRPHFSMRLRARDRYRPGKFRPLAVVNQSRLKDYPDIPTMKEVGYPDVGTVAWNGLFAPAATPKPVLEALFAAVNKTLSSPEAIEKLQQAELQCRAEQVACGCENLARRRDQALADHHYRREDRYDAVETSRHATSSVMRKLQRYVWRRRRSTSRIKVVTIEQAALTPAMKFPETFGIPRRCGAAARRRSPVPTSGRPRPASAFPGSSRRSSRFMPSATIRPVGSHETVTGR